MLGFPSTVRRRRAVRAARTARLAVNWLEVRDTPSTLAASPAPLPVLSPLSGVVQSDGSVLVSGHVTDANPATVTVTVGGAASAQFHPNSAGDFGVVLHLSGNGTVISVQASDDQSLQAQPVTYDTAQAGPTATPTASGTPATTTAAGTTTTTVTQDGSGATAAQRQTTAATNKDVFVEAWDDDEGWHIGGGIGDAPPGGGHVVISSGDPRLNGLEGDLNSDGSFNIDVSLPDGDASGFTVNVYDGSGNLVGTGSGQIGA